MTLNFPAPHQIDIRYTTTPTGFVTMEHHLTLGVVVESGYAIGDSFVDIVVINKNLTTQTLDTAVDALIAGLLSFYPASTDFIDCTLNKYTGQSYEAEWQAVYEISEVGTAITPSTVAHQDTITLRTDQGGICRFQFMESVRTESTRASFPTAAATINALKDFLTNVAQPWIGQDGGRLVAGNFWCGTQNEKLAKKRYRS